MVNEGWSTRAMGRVARLLEPKPLSRRGRIVAVLFTVAFAYWFWWMMPPSREWDGKPVPPAAYCFDCATTTTTGK